MKALSLSFVLTLAALAGAAAEPRILGPYVSWIGTATPTVMLHTETPDEAILTIPGKGGAVATTLRSQGRHHRFPIPPALAAKPGELEYRIAAGGATSGPHRLAIPDRNAKDFSFVVVGDAQNGNSPERRQKTMAALAAHHPAFIIHTGDLLDGRDKADTADLFGKDWRINFFAPMPPLQAAIPFYPVLGNHDAETPEQRASFMTAFPEMPKEARYSFAHGGVAFFFMDIRHQIREFAKNGQDAWLAQEAARYPDAAWKVAVFHVSPWSGGHRGEREWTVGGRERMLAALQAAGIDLVFCGHDHNYQRIKPLAISGSTARPVQIVITGVTGSSFYEAAEKPYTAKVVNRRDHFCAVNASPTEIAIRAIAVDGTVLDDFTIRRDQPPKGILRIDGP